MNVLAIDIGSSSVKAALLRGDRVVKSARAEFPTRYGDRRAEVDATRIMSAVVRAIRDLGPAVKSVDLIAPTVMAPSWLAMDSRGEAITPVVTHQDRRSIDIARDIERHVGKARHLQLTGNRPFPGGLSSTTAAWFLKHERPLMKRADLVGHLSTYLIRQWTGARVTDPSNASFMGVYNTCTLDGWNKSLCKVIGLSQKLLPEIRDANFIAGHLTPLAASRSGLRGGTPILTGCMDTSAAMLALGAKPGHLLNSLGSTDVLAVCTSKPHPHERLLTRALGVGRTWMSVSTLAAGGSSVAWAHRQLFADLSEMQFYALLKKLPQVDVQFDPYLSGERTAVEQKQAGFSGLSLSTTREEMLAAVVNALAAASAGRLPVLAKVAKLSKSVTVTGGGAGSEIFHRDWGRGWRFTPRQDLTALGLAALAAMAR